MKEILQWDKTGLMSETSSAWSQIASLPTEYKKVTESTFQIQTYGAGG